ncbi:lytic exoenzyme target recognition domain-containing protein [Enterococcus sp. DIV1420a]|uniref:lytic exoenzyme target recognition domain-containing protein n=1 Tax=Enterococcus sp. DIV1420a TaxID=2774672 RepID=UPI003F2778BB
MTVSIQKTIDYMLELKRKDICYSMTGSRDGSDGTGDCSGTVVRAVQLAGGTKPGWLYNTDSMHAYLIENGYQLIFENQPTYEPKKGDIFIWGEKGQSSGAFGHTGIFYDDQENIIHCNYGYNGVTINNVDEIARANGYPYYYIYRASVVNNSQPGPQVQALAQEKPAPKPKRRYGYRVDDLQFLNGIWQVRNDVLGQPDFDWTDNGINVAYIDKIDPGTGENTPDQTLNVGDYFAFQPASVGIITEQVNTAGKTLSHVQFPDEFIWLYTPSIEKLIYG